MPKELNDDTLEKLAQEGITDGDDAAKAAAEAEAKAKAEAEAKAEADKGALPDITISTDGGKTAAEQALLDDAEAKRKASASGGEDSDLDKSVSKTLEGAGFDNDTVVARLTKDNGISDEFVAELKLKIDPDFVDAHVGRMRAELELAKVKESGRLDEVHAKEKALKTMNDHIFNSVGGADKFKVLGDTLKSNMSAEDLAALNVKLASGNKQVVDEALVGAVKTYNNIRGMGGKLMEGDAGQGQEPEEHVTKAEYRAIMRTEKYKTDAKYQRKVDADRLRTRENDAKMYGAGQYFGFHKEKGQYPL